jgi:hypothetical protein
VGRDHQRSGYYRELFAMDLEGKNKKHTANEICQSCALALGQMVKPVDDDKAADKDAEYCRLLLDQARANIAAAQANIDTINRQIEEQRFAVEQARQQIVSDQAALVYSQQNSQRYTALARTGYGTVQMA